MKPNIIFTFFLISTLSMLFTLNGDQKAQVTFDEMKELHFPKIKKYNIGLVCVSPSQDRIFKQGTKGKLTFRLQNYSFKRLKVYEWYAKEQYNIKLYWILWENQKKLPPKKDWHVILPKLPKKPKRMILELAHRNSVIIDKELPFIEKIKSDKSLTFVIIAELNLYSIKAYSKPISIVVEP